ncbi:MAG: nucleotidyl transferase AbiEii/AbiGii toxin family protein [bacterium]
MNQIILKLKDKLGQITNQYDVETQRNILKEELQFYILNFIYNHPTYSEWIMYGGSALRICHKLDRMSVDLDFEIKPVVSEDFLNKVQNELEQYFINNYNINSNFFVIKKLNNRGLRLNFNIGGLEFNHTSKQVHVKIDLNCFTAPKTVTERIPIIRDQFAFVIKTYNMSSLMASKIAAVLLRGKRGVGKAIYEEKGRDIYDLLWYMGQKIVPDLDYLVAKGINVKDLRALFNKLTLQMDKVSDDNLKQDLTPLFTNQIFINNWLKNWRESYSMILKEYEIHTASDLESIGVHQDFYNDNFSFVYWYKVEDGTSVRITYNISNFWIIFREGDLLLNIGDKVNEFIKFYEIKKRSAKLDKLKQYATLFYEKTENYLKKTNHVILGEAIETKVIKMKNDNLDQKKQIFLDKATLISCELEDLLE